MQSHYNNIGHFFKVYVHFNERKMIYKLFEKKKKKKDVEDKYQNNEMIIFTKEM